MTTKPGRVVAYDKTNSPVMSDESLITWSREFTWLIQSLISLFSQGLWLPNMTGWWLMVRRTYLWTHMILWQSGDVRSRDKSKVQHILFGKTYGYETWQIDDLWWGKRIHQSHVLLTTWLRKVTWQTKNEIFLPPEDLWPHCSVLTYGEVKSIMKLHKSDRLITRGHVSNWKLNISSSTRPIPPHLTGWWRGTLWRCSLVRSHEKFKTKI